MTTVDYYTKNFQKAKTTENFRFAVVFGFMLQKRYPIKNENSGFGFDLFSFLHCDFSVFHFGCLISTKEGNHENVA